MEKNGKKRQQTRKTEGKIRREREKKEGKKKEKSGGKERHDNPHLIPTGRKETFLYKECRD